MQSDSPVSSTDGLKHAVLVPDNSSILKKGNLPRDCFAYCYLLATTQDNEKIKGKREYRYQNVVLLYIPFAGRVFRLSQRL